MHDQMAYFMAMSYSKNKTVDFGILGGLLLISLSLSSINLLFCMVDSWATSASAHSPSCFWGSAIYCMVGFAAYWGLNLF